jgi:DNA-binding response OmpR family regulator
MGETMRVGSRALHAQAGGATPRNGTSAAARRDVRLRELHPAEPQEASGGAPESPLRIAILDRDTGFLLVFGKRLESVGWRWRTLPVRGSAKALAGLEADVLVVDLALLGARRWRWLTAVCERRPDVRVIVCTGASTVAERVCALRMGADDWLRKPCHPEELIARIGAVTGGSRRVPTRDLEPLTVGELEIRPDLFQAFVGGRDLCLTRREYQLVELLARAEGEVLAREQIYECLWGTAMLGNERSVDVFVHKLRRKLEHSSPGWSYVHTHFGVGYRLLGEPRETSELERGEAMVEAIAA